MEMNVKTEKISQQQQRGELTYIFHPDLHVGKKPRQRSSLFPKPRVVALQTTTNKKSAEAGKGPVGNGA